jgi:hypothetical protein
MTKQVLAGVGLVLCAAALLVGPLLPWGWLKAARALGVALDVVALLGLLWLLQLWRGFGEPSRALGSWRAWVVGAGWSLLVTFELGRLASRQATNEDLPIYDLLLLSRHLFILTRDLYGGWAHAGVAAALAVPLVLWGFAALLLGRVEAGARALGPRRAAAAVLWMVPLGLLPASRVVAPDLAANTSESLTLALEVREDVAGRPQAGLVGAELARKPDVLVYIVESYGGVVRDELLGERWASAVDQIEAHLEARGWRTASGLSAAPVHGGRSWIADASLLSGLHVARQATYEHVISMVDSLDHFPRLMDDFGYDTVLVRPKDRARPGVELVNHFRFEHTVFRDDLRYEGPIVGWGEVPDQYTVGWVHDHLIADLDGPVFAFFHLATAHMPWRQAPELVDDYLEWQTRSGRTAPVFKERSFESERAMRLSRFKSRYRQPKEDPEVDEIEANHYLDAVIYDLEVITRQHAGGPDGDQVLLVLGDHQPPMIARGTGMEVPVHVLASDPELLRGFLEVGFEPGLRPTGEAPTVEHRQLLAVLLRSLVR